MGEAKRRKQLLGESYGKPNIVREFLSLAINASNVVGLMSDKELIREKTISFFQDLIASPQKKAKVFCVNLEEEETSIGEAWVELEFFKKEFPETPPIDSVDFESERLVGFLIPATDHKTLGWAVAYNLDQLKADLAQFLSIKGED